MKKIKTVAIFSAYTYPHLGGIEKYTENLKNELIKLNYNVIIIGTDYNFSGKYKEKNKKKLNYRLPVHKLFVNRYPIPKKNKIYKSILKELKEQNVDAIIVNTRFFLTTLVGAKFGKKNNIPVFLVEHGSQHLTIDNKILDFFGAIYEHLLTRYVKKYVNCYYGVSKGACEWQKHFHIKSNGVWYNSINDFSKKMIIEKDKKNINILYAGRILKQKGLNRLLESFEKLNKKYSNIRLTIAGDGNLLPELKEMYKNKNINFLGKIDFNELKKLYAKTDIFVYAPIWPEGLPTSILEAGLTNCAVIGSPQGGIKEIIHDNETGIMINTDEELYQKMEELIINKKKRENLSNNLKEYIINNFLWENTTKKIIYDINDYIKKGDK